jgi:2-keto-3-deoxy-L-rhamnonate aldolase RhmA
MRDAGLKQRLAAKEFLLGGVITIPSPQLVEIAGWSGFDYVVVDMEHSAIEFAQAEELVRAAEAAHVPALVRVATNRPELILKALAIGATGVQIPQVGTGEEARRAVSAAYYAPRGERGVGPGRSSRQGLAGPMHQHVAAANREVVVVVQIEDVEAIPRLDQILTVPGIDLAFSGGADLSQSLGEPGRTDSPAVQDAMRRIREGANRIGVPIGTPVRSSVDAATVRGAGYQAATVQLISLAAQTFRTLIEDFRKTSGGATQ